MEEAVQLLRGRFEVEPALDVVTGKIMELHHSKHHAAYVAGVNGALDALAEARDKNDFGAINKLQKDLAFHLGGHVNHSIFWKNMKGGGGGQPTGALADQIAERADASLVYSVGKVIVLFRPKPDEDATDETDS